MKAMRVCLLLLLGLWPAVPVPPAAGAGRVALVIGNASYAAMPLANPVNDARLMAETLRALGFEVIQRENASKREMELAILDFGEKLKSAGAGVFYYAGHGLQVRGRNYLIPVEAAIETEAAARVEGVDVDLVLAEMGDARNAAANIVILDACRNNPFERRMRGGARGLAAIDAAAGTLIAYATAPGSTASDGTGTNGLYTEELVKALKQPGLKAEEVFKRVRVQVMQRSAGAQTPWESSSLTGELVFNQAAAAPQATSIAAAPQPAPAQAAPPATQRTGGGDDQAELAFWDAIKNSGIPAEFRAYLESFPNGRFAPLARLRAQQGGPQPTQTAAAPAGAAPPPRPPAPAAPAA
ncbi:MAG: caspase family protein, partial [Alphaproteobacteria bacterium]|nr:caspase family protein [Alphaproteobacteria bacterium]